jgi:hypothetical protein
MSHDEGRWQVLAAAMPLDEPRPRGTVIRRQITGFPLTDAEHYFRCSLCGGIIDARDRAWIEEHQTALPHPACDRAQ